MTEPMKPASNGAPTNETLAAVLEELRQITRENGKPREQPRLPLTQSAARVSFPPSRVPPPEKPKSRARYWIVGGGVLVACAALAVPFRSVVFDAGLLGSKAPPAAAAKAPSTPIASSFTLASAPAAMPGPSTTPASAPTQASAPAKAPPPVTPPPVSAPAPATVLASAAPKPVEPVASAAAKPKAIETASALNDLPLAKEIASAPVNTTASITPQVRLEKALPPVDPPPSLSLDRDLVRSDRPAPPVVPAAPPVEAPPSVASVAPVPSLGAGHRTGPEGPQTRVAALGPIPESSATTAVIPAPAVPAAAKPSPDADRLMGRAQELIKGGDISAARLLLQRAMQSGSPQAAFQLAETYDPQILAKWGARGIRGDVDRARELYSQALKQGVSDSTPRLEALR